MASITHAGSEHECQSIAEEELKEGDDLNNNDEVLDEEERIISL